MIFTTTTSTGLVTQAGNHGDVCILTDSLTGGIFVPLSGTIVPDNMASQQQPHS